MKKSVRLRDLGCAHCAAKMEQAIRRIDGVQAVNVNFLLQKLTIEAEEQRFDGTAADHGHFRCSACGEIFDFPLEEEKLAALCPEGYEVQVRDVYLQGRCPACGAPHSCPQ